jgi:pimeloyl-ACP methyl ester carboxylesterase
LRAITSSKTAATKEARRSSTRCQDRFALAALHRAPPQQAITADQARAVTVPTLGVVGSLDPYLGDFRELKTLDPALTLVVIYKATHGSAMRQPEFIAAGRDFLGSHRSSSGTR